MNDQLQFGENSRLWLQEYFLITFVRLFRALVARMNTQLCLEVHESLKREN